MEFASGQWWIVVKIKLYQHFDLFFETGKRFCGKIWKRQRIKSEKKENFVLTYSGKCDIIIKLLSMANKQDLKIFMEVNADKLFEDLDPHCKRQIACFKNRTMVNRIENLEVASKYLLEFFKITGEKYSCSRTKIGKLLSIVAFVYARKDVRIFKEEIHKYNDCGTSIDELRSFVPLNLYRNSTYSDNNASISDDLSIDNTTDEYSILSNELRKTIKNVFMRFGAYLPLNLGKSINAIVEYPGVTSDDGIINLDAIKNIDVNNISAFHNRDVIEYILNCSKEG